jgi:hypothetical protein
MVYHAIQAQWQPPPSIKIIRVQDHDPQRLRLSFFRR